MYQIKLSPYHKIFYYEWKLDPFSSKYNIVFDQTLTGNLDVERLQQALQRFISDYVILNSHVKEIDSCLYWIKNSNLNPLEIYTKGYTKQQIYDLVSKPFNLENEPLYRFAIFRGSNSSYRFIITIHHILIDGSIFDIFVSEISNYYNNLKYKALYTINRQIKEIILTENKLYEKLSDSVTKHQLFWQNLLSNYSPIDIRFIKLSVPFQPIKKFNNTINEIRFSFDEKVCYTLEKLKNEYKISQFFYGQMIFAILLFKYTAQENLAICYPVEIIKLKKIIYGAKININIFTYSLNNQTTILDLLEQISNFKKNVSEHSTYPINNIIGNENKGLLNVVFGQTNFKDIHFDFTNIKVKVNNEFNIDVSAKLLFEQEKTKNKLNYRVRYDVIKMDSCILNQFIEHYKKLFITILDDLDKNITSKEVNTYPILTNTEIKKLIYTWNKTQQLYPINNTIKQLFEKQVECTPYNVAITYGNKHVTYHELNNKSNQLCSYLMANYNLTAYDLIALFLDRNEYMVIAILWILKAGGTYVPISTNFPQERVKYILEDTKAKIIITTEHYSRGFSNLATFNNKHNNIKQGFNHKIILVDSKNFQKELLIQPITNHKWVSAASDLVYIMYTSATTGNPKGVMVENQHVASFAINNNYIQLGSSNTILGYSDYAFDGSVFDIFCSLLNGARLVIADKKQILNPNSLQQLIIQNNIDTVFITTALLNQYIASGNNPLNSLKNILFGGEKANPKILKLLVESNPEINLLNVYGPTETIVFSTFCKLDKNNVEIAPIGKPLNDKKVYILDKYKNLLPIGAIGELYIGGSGVARGYLNLPELTNDKFIANPFQTVEEKRANANNRLYKTGDLVRYLPNGNIVYIDRNDFQVKIRGYRVELSEIETKLLDYPGIEQVITFIHGTDQHKFLVAYYVSTHKLDEIAIHNYLKGALPQYMQPQILMYIEKFPLTANGKVDKYALPLPKIYNTDEFVSPKNLLETQICIMFSEILNLPLKNISVNHDFFTVGGNSINAIQLTAKLQKNFNIGVNDIYRLRTPAQIASFIPYTHTKDNLQNKLEQIKQIYAEVKKFPTKLATSEHIKIQFEQIPKNISTVLLTGATGHLGCHVLHKLLTMTTYKVYLLVRPDKYNAENISVYQRLNNKFNYYFEMNLDQFQNRIIILESDITLSNLGLSELDYQELTNVDSIVHCAALVKHYGEYPRFYKANVQATINLLELCKLTKFKDFHYISTIGIFFDNYILNDYSIFTEDDIDKIVINKDNFYTHYTQTKYIGEQVVIQYRQYGIKSNIYRVGNLAMNSKNYKNQENIEENAFFQRVKTILNFGVIPKELSEAEISPVDCVAEAIIKLFQQERLVNQVFHIFNPNICNLYQLFAKCKNINITTISFNSFIDIILKNLYSSRDTKQIELFMLHQGWLNEKTNINNQIKIMQNKTNIILNYLKFVWPTITSDMLSDIITQSCGKDK